MSIDYPIYEDKQILTPEDLNDFVQDLKDKFAAGVGSADITWPLLAEGNLQLDTHQIVGGRSIWGVVNAAEYATLDAALVAASGGICFIPPGEVIEASAVSIPGNKTTIIGCGQSSEIRASAGATGSLLKNANSGPLSRLTIMNVRINGNNETCDGLELSGAQYTKLHGVHFENFDGNALVLTSAGATNPEHITISDCHFNINTIHVDIEACRDVVISSCYFGQSDDTSVRASGSTINRLSVSDNVFYAADAESIQILGGAAAYAAAAGEIVIADNLIDGSGMTDLVPCIEVGSASGRIQGVTITGNQITSPGTDGIKVYARYGTISGNTARGAGGDGLDLLSSEDMLVVGNNFRDATAYGIDATDCTDCVIRANDCAGATTGDIAFSDSTDHYDNGDVVAPGPPRVFYAQSDPLIELTVPAGLLHVGDHLYAGLSAQVTAGSSDTLKLVFNGTTVASVGVNGAVPTNAQLESHIFVTGATTFDVMWSAVKSVDGSAICGFVSRTGLDLSTDTILTVSNTGASITKHCLMAELGRAQIVS